MGNHLLKEKEKNFKKYFFFLILNITRLWFFDIGNVSHVLDLEMLPKYKVLRNKSTPVNKWKPHHLFVNYQFRVRITGFCIFCHFANLQIFRKKIPQIMRAAFTLVSITCNNLVRYYVDKITHTKKNIFHMSKRLK